MDGTETQQVSPIRLNVLFEVFHAYKHVWNTCSKYVLSDLFLMNDRPEAVFLYSGYIRLNTPNWKKGVSYVFHQTRNSGLNKSDFSMRRLQLKHKPNMIKKGEILYSVFYRYSIRVYLSSLNFFFHLKFPVFHAAGLQVSPYSLRYSLSGA